MPLGAANLNLLGKYFAPAATGRSAIDITAVNDTQVDTAVSKFGTGSMLMDGTGDYAYISGGTVDLSGDFTIEMWWYFNGLQTANILDWRGIHSTHTGGGTGTFALSSTLLIGHNSGDFRCWIDGSDRSTSGVIFSTGTWYHVAVQRQSGTVNAWVNGTRYVDYSGSTDDYSSVLAANQPIGANSSTSSQVSYLNGAIDEFRISTVARYTNGASIPVPSAPFVSDDDTYLLHHFDGTDGSTTFEDDVDSTVFELESVANTSNLTYNARSYQIPKISYAGDDSSGQPVFFVGTRNTSGNFVCSLIRRNNDGTISESAVTTLKSTDERFNAQGVAGLDSSGNPVGVTVGTYRISGVIYSDIYCNQIDLDNLSLGTTYSSTDFTSATPNAGFAYATYFGANGKFGCGYRKTGIRTALTTVNSSTISVGNEVHESSFGDGVYQGIYGLSYQDDSDYLYMMANGNANQHGAGYFNGADAGGSVYSNTLAVGLARTEPFELAYNKMLTVARSGSNADMLVSSITWPGTGDPTFTNGSVTAFSDEASWSSSFCGAADTATNTVYILYKHSTNGWQIKPITASGTTPSEGTTISVDVDEINWGKGDTSNAACFASSAQGDLFVALIDDTGSNNPKIYIGAV